MDCFNVETDWLYATYDGTKEDNLEIYVSKDPPTTATSRYASVGHGIEVSFMIRGTNKK
jgi:hypothetical protein